MKIKASPWGKARTSLVPSTAPIAAMGTGAGCTWQLFWGIDVVVDADGVAWASDASVGGAVAELVRGLGTAGGSGGSLGPARALHMALRHRPPWRLPLMRVLPPCGINRARLWARHPLWAVRNQQTHIAVQHSCRPLPRQCIAGHGTPSPFALE